MLTKAVWKSRIRGFSFLIIRVEVGGGDEI